MSSRVFDFAEHEARLDTIIRQSFTTSFMSNSKWRRFFLALAEHHPEITHLRWKFVGKELSLRGAAPDSDCLGDRYVTRTSFSTFPYKEIEWIEIPGMADLPLAVQDMGQFDTVATSSGVRVFGYR